MMRRQERIHLAFGEEPVFELIAAREAAQLRSQIRCLRDHRPPRIVGHSDVGRRGGCELARTGRCARTRTLSGWVGRRISRQFGGSANRHTRLHCDVGRIACGDNIKHASAGQLPRIRDSSIRHNLSGAHLRFARARGCVTCCRYLPNSRPSCGCASANSTVACR